MKEFFAGQFDIAVIGAGHAGIEAALAAARMGLETVCLTMNLDAVGNMPCNPAIGGTGKGHLVRELDALGGEMARGADAACIQYRMLNRGKGPAVHSLRAQADRRKYQQVMKHTLERQEHLTLRQGEVVALRTEDGSVRQVVLRTGAVYGVRAVILCSGTYLHGRTIVGECVESSGPDGLHPSGELADCLAAMGLPLRRFKTGTPPRINARTVDFDRMEVQTGDDVPVPFSFSTTRPPENRAVCWLTYTNEETHRIIRENLDRSPIYTGVIRNGDSQSEMLPELQIIDAETYERAQQMMEKRVTHHDDVPLNTKGQSLLVGNIYCGHCGGRLTLTTSGRKRARKDGTVIRETRARYQCHYNIRHPGECDGQSGYGVEKLDKLVDQIIRIQLGRIRSAPSQELIAKQQAKEVDLAKSKLNLLNEQYRQKQREYQDLRAETIKVIQGTSRLNVDLLNSLVAETSEQIKQLSWQIQTATAELEETVQSASQVLREYDQLIGWAEMYGNCTFEAKKMIVAQFVKEVHVRRDYEIDIEFNVSFEEFQALYLDKEPEEIRGRRNDTVLAMETKTRQVV